MKGKAKIWCLVIASLIVFLTISPAVAKDLLIFTVDQAPAGTAFVEWDLTLGGCQQYGLITELLYVDCKDVDIEAGDISGDKYSDVDDLVSGWGNGLWIYRNANNSWIRVNPQAPKRVAVGDLGKDEKLEIIGSYGTGLFFFYWGGSGWAWRRITSYVPIGDIAAGDIDGDGLDEVVAGFKTGTWYWNPADDQWTQITAYNAYNLAVGDMNGDGLAEVAGAFPSGIWSWDRGKWRRLTDTGFATKGDIAFGDYDGNGKDDLASCWPGGRLWALWDNGKWERIIGCGDDLDAERVTKGKIR